MKILYGVQATGQGHISRAKAMLEAFSKHSVDITWLFSGRPREDFFDMSAFGNFEYRKGLTFTTDAGRLKYYSTVKNNSVWQFISDVRSLHVSAYDAVITDFEPVSAWAARIRGVRSIGIGHQYAFGKGTPRAGSNIANKIVMDNFAPVSTPLGLHWHPYAVNVLPPILHLPDISTRDDDYVLVYLPFENQKEVTQLLQSFPGTEFVQYSSILNAGRVGNVSLNPLNTASFKQHLAHCSGVFCNSGFELISECLQWGKRVITKPLAGQPEQLSNALALTQLGYAEITRTLCRESLSNWLQYRRKVAYTCFPDVAAELARWVADNFNEPVADLHSRLWSQKGIIPQHEMGLTNSDALETMSRKDAA